MSKLCLSLPPLAPDYSGAASALFDLGGMIVIHDASGCTGNYVGYDEPRWFNSKTPVFCSGLRHMDAILGTDDIFIDRVLNAAESLKPKFIAILGSPVPMVIGTDFEGIALEIENRSGIPVLGIATNGLKYYGTGYSQAIIPLIKKIVKKQSLENKKENAINILGVTPLDFSINKNDSDFRELFESNGISVIANYCMGLSFQDIENSVNAKLNVVVSQSGIETARFMFEHFGIPFTVQTPIGTKPLVLDHVNKILSNELVEDEYGFIPFVNQIENKADNKSILIIGDQVISLSIRNFLYSQGCKHKIQIASLFDTTQALLEEDDYAIKNEKHLRTILAENEFDSLIADPLVFSLNKKPNTKCIGFNHPGVSGRLSWNSCPRFMTKEVETLLNGAC